MTEDINITVRSATSNAAAAFDTIAGSRQGSGWASLDAPTSRSLLAQASDETPLGFIEARQAGDDVEIIMIETHPSARRTGVATRLLEQLLVDARASGASRVILDVAEDNAPARGLYDKVGFAEIGRRNGYYRASDASTPNGEPRDALLLAHHFASGTGER